jgi:hypothetical protein
MPPTSEERDPKESAWCEQNPRVRIPIDLEYPWVWVIPRKEVIQPHLPVRLPCYDFTPVTWPTFDGCPQLVSPPASGVPRSHGVTGGVYKTREHIHRRVLTGGY